MISLVVYQQDNLHIICGNGVIFPYCAATVKSRLSREQVRSSNNNYPEQESSFLESFRLGKDFFYNL